MLRRTALILALCGSCAFPQAIPARPEQLAFTPMTFQVPRVREHRAKLKNGIPVLLSVSSQEASPLVRVTVSWRGGAFLDPKGREGLAQLFGAQLARGGTTRLEPAKLEDRLEALAATLSSSCGETTGSLSLQVLDQDLDEGLGLLLQVLQEPAFSQDRLDLARRQQRQALARRNDAVTSIAAYQMNFLLFGEDHFASADPTAASLEALTREDLQAFHARLLHPANLVVTVSGKLDRKVILDKLNAGLGALKAGPQAQVCPAVPAPAFQRRPGIYVSDKDAPQAMVQWAFPGLRRTDPDWHAAVVMNQVLGASGFTSRLMKKIRSDEGLTYGVRTALGPGPHWRGDLTGSMQTKNRSVAYALRLALVEMQKLRDIPVPVEELKVIQDNLVEAFPSQWGSRQAVAGRFTDETLIGAGDDWWADYREKIQAVSPADVQRMARKLIQPDQLVILAVGRAAEMEPGDPDHPGPLAELAKLPLVRLPLRDPLTLRPLN